MKAGSNFGGVTPVDGATPLTPTLADDIFKFDAGTEGGLFDLWDDDMYSFHPLNALYLVGVELQLSDQTAWSLSRVDVDGSSVIIVSGTTGASAYYGFGSQPCPTGLLRGSSLKLSTTAASGAMVATLKFMP
jgi:hypothetical protein